MSDLKATLKTNRGDIVLNLFPDHAPKTVENFVGLAEGTKDYKDDAGRSGERYYDGLGFHRVIANFMIQGGGFTPKMEQKPTKPPIPLESRNGLHNVRGSVAMARTGDPNSATAQFFINTVDNAFLDADNARDGNGYAVFGQVIEGMDVVDKIRAVPVTDSGMFQNVPQTPVIITKAIVEPKK